LAIEEQLLAESIRASFKKAEAARLRYSDVLERQDSESANDPDNDEVQEASETLRYWVWHCFNDVAVLAERLGLKQSTRQILKARKRIKHLDSLVPTNYDVSLHSEPLATARSYFNPLEVMVSGGEINAVTVLETVLHNTAKIVHDKDIAPSKETEVYNEVFKVLQYSFRGSCAVV